MKKNNLVVYTALILTALMFNACQKNNDKGSSIPVIKSLNITSGSTVNMPDSIAFDALLSDDATPLSTLEIDILVNDSSMVHESIRTKGNQVQLNGAKIRLPYIANVPNGATKIRFTLINIDGNEAMQEESVNVVRPTLPNLLYLKVDDDYIPFTQDPTKPDLYKTDEGEYESIFMGQMCTSNDISTAQYIWKAGVLDNLAEIGDEFSDPISISYPTTLVSRLIFNTLDFTIAAEGTNVNLVVNGNQMQGNGAYFYSKINFVKNTEFTVTGLTPAQSEIAYNRDFFTYNPTTDKYTFIGETGSWDVYYSLKYNYFWVNKMDDVAPATYWIVGNGFCSASRWNSDFDNLGWDTSDVKQNAYMKQIAPNKYQATVYITSAFDMQMYVDLNWGDVAEFTSTQAFTGDDAGAKAAGDILGDIIDDGTFTPGYYVITMDISAGQNNATVDFKRL